NVLRVRENIDSYEDPGPYSFPEGSVSYKATAEEMARDGIHVNMVEDRAADGATGHMHNHK
ncbi:MAG: copper oxidase, partial [Candidatus Pacebacteria bacterium]|nr:copper oxidase [Candidatus Paceibacterota bacterium]